ncbi:MAG TPA: ATP-dependent helicase [Ktedonobacterales bacterium]|nr:ATP-dependent helicase [Ktedonobacterales bacterium]
MATSIFFACPRPAPSKRARKTAAGNPMIAAFGAGPDGATCGKCVHCASLDFASGRIHKCDVAANATDVKTDWHVRWPACGIYEPLEAPKPKRTRKSKKAAEAEMAQPVAQLTAKFATVAPVTVDYASRLAFTPSLYQEAIYRWLETARPDATLIVAALAGSGKTTSLVGAAKLLPPGASAVFVAFNKHIAEELASRLRGTPMVAKTVHSIGMATLQSAIQPKIQIENGKYRKIARDLVQYEIVKGYGNEQRAASDMLTKLLNFVRLTLTDPTDSAALDAMMEHYDISDPSLDDHIIEELKGAIVGALKEGAKQAERNGLIDFTDMIWLPNYLHLTPTQADYVFCDEAQDLNAAQRELVLALRKPGGRMVFVGDAHQAIYGFAGADTASFASIKERTGADELPLSICYRCPPNVIALAREVVPEIEAAAGKPNGVIGYISESELAAIVRPGDLILCRLTAPLVSECIRLIQRRVSARVRGRDIGKQLTDVIKAVTDLDGYAWEMFPQLLQKWRDIQLHKLSAREDTESQIEALLDRVDAIQTCYDSFQARDANDLSHQLEDLFDDGKPAVMLSTVHRAKGLEEERVFILKPEKLPLIWPKQQAHQYEQEMNLRYVAITRAKRELYFVGDGAAVQARLPFDSEGAAK